MYLAYMRDLCGEQYILDPYVTTSYCISKLKKIDNFVNQKMKIILDKCKHEQTEAYECIFK